MTDTPHTPDPLAAIRARMEDPLSVALARLERAEAALREVEGVSHYRKVDDYGRDYRAGYLHGSSRAAGYARRYFEGEA